MFSDTAVPSDVVGAYLATDFHVLGEGAFILRINQPSAELASLLLQAGAETAAFLTAWNPHSELLSLPENQAAQGNLLVELKSRQYEVIPGIGRDPSGEWEGEESYLVLGISRAEAQALGSRFGQNAIVWSGRDAVPELILLR